MMELFILWESIFIYDLGITEVISTTKNTNLQSLVFYLHEFHYTYEQNFTVTYKLQYIDIEQKPGNENKFCVERSSAKS